VKEELQVCDIGDEGLTAPLSKNRPGSTVMQPINDVGSLLLNRVRWFVFALLEHALAALLCRLNLTH
jgi:hypothetical protein